MWSTSIQQPRVHSPQLVFSLPMAASTPSLLAAIRHLESRGLSSSIRHFWDSSPIGSNPRGSCSAWNFTLSWLQSFKQGVLVLPSPPPLISAIPTEPRKPSFKTAKRKSLHVSKGLRLGRRHAQELAEREREREKVGGATISTPCPAQYPYYLLKGSCGTQQSPYHPRRYLSGSVSAILFLP